MAKIKSEVAVIPTMDFNSPAVLKHEEISKLRQVLCMFRKDRDQVEQLWTMLMKDT